jgi:muconate cycloisomerase
MAEHPRIERVETFLVDLPTIRPHRLSMTTMSGQTLMLVRIHTSDGIVGLGEGTTIGGLAYGAESPESMKLAIDTYFTPHLLKGNPNQIGALMATIGKAARNNHFAKCAVETALFDALGKRRGLSVAELMGGGGRTPIQPCSRSTACGVDPGERRHRARYRGSRGNAFAPAA